MMKRAGGGRQGISAPHRHAYRIAGASLLFLACYFGPVGEAQAYVDPNAAGLLFQILTPILAVVAAGIAAVRMWSVQWYGTMRNAFRRSPSEASPAQMSRRRTLFARLWGSLVSIAVASSLVDCILHVLAAADGWLEFLKPWEVMFSIAWQLALAVAEGAVVGSLATAMAAPILLMRSPARRARWVQNVIAAALACAFLLFGMLLLRQSFQWMTAVGFAPPRFVRLIALLAFGCALAASLYFRKSRQRTLRSLDVGYNGKLTRRTLLAVGATAAAASVLDPRFAVPKAVAGASGAVRGSGQNVVLITFDALGARHMSLYGNQLPTTPNIDAFARTASTFTNFYACSTFTTPSAVACLTGRYPSETQVYHLDGFLRGRAAERNLARELLTAGYFTAASVTNPYAHPDRLGIGEDFLLRPAPPLIGHPISGALLHGRDPLLARLFRAREAFVLHQIDRFVPIGSEYPPARSFAQARDLLSEIGEHRPFFLWIHVLAPHGPYKPRPPYLRKFYTGDYPAGLEAEVYNATDFRYGPELQPTIDKLHLRYQEYVAECDDAFGDFMTFLDARPGPRTSVIVSADHGESFTGGVFTHGGPNQVGQIVNIPLVIRSPRHTAGARVTRAADQTSLAPTILELAGLPRPAWMRGPSLIAGADDAVRPGGEAFTQYLELNSIFEPIRRGTVGLIDGIHQFVVDLESRRGILRPLAEADMADGDRSQENPALAAEMRRRIFTRFPGLSDDNG